MLTTNKKCLKKAEQLKREKANKALVAQQEQRKQAEEDRRRKAEEDRKVREEQRARRELEDKEKQRKAEVETRRRELEEKKAMEARKRLEEKRRKAEEEVRKKEEEAKRKEEEKKRAEERLRLDEERALEEEKRQKVRGRNRFLCPLFWPLSSVPFSRLPYDDAPGALSFLGGFRWEQEAEEERARREFEAQMEAVSQLDMLHKEEQSR